MPDLDASDNTFAMPYIQCITVLKQLQGITVHCMEWVVLNTGILYECARKSWDLILRTGGCRRKVALLLWFASHLSANRT